MSFEALAQAHLDRLASFLDDPSEVVLSLRTDDPKIAGKMISRIERLPSRTIAAIDLPGSYAGDDDYFATAALRIRDDLSRAAPELERAGLSIDVQPMRNHRPAELADWLERLRRALAPQISHLVVVLAGPSHHHEAFAGAMLELAAATASAHIKYLVLESTAHPGLPTRSIQRQRMTTSDDVDDGARISHAFTPRRRVLTFARDQRPDWTLAAARAELTPARVLTFAADVVSDRWSFFSALEDAAAKLSRETSPGPPRADLAARFAEHLESLAPPDGSLLLWLDLGASTSLVQELVHDLARAACSDRVRYVVTLPTPVSSLPPARTARHDVHFRAEDVMAGYQAAIANPATSLSNRVLALCMLSGFVANGPKRASTETRTRSIELAGEAVTLSRDLEPIARVMALLALGNALLAAEEPARARDAYAVAAQLSAENGNLALAAQALGQIGIAHAKMRDFTRAATALDAAAGAYHRVGSPLGRAQMLLWCGDAHLAQHRYEPAATSWLQALEAVEQLGDGFAGAAGDAACQAHLRLASAYEQASHPARAREHRDAAQAIAPDAFVVLAF